MAVKSIIEVDVNDEAFKGFVALFKKYQDALSKSPELWSQTNKSVDGVTSGVTNVVSAIGAQTAALTKAVKAQESMRTTVDKTHTSMKTLAVSTWRVAGGLKDITLSLLRWGSLTSAFSLLTGASGFFGYSALARSASTARTQSMGLGISPGQLQAANITYDRFGGAAPTLGRIADIQNTQEQQYRLTHQLGISQGDVQNQTPFELLPQVLRRVRERYLAIPENLRGTLSQAYGLTEFGLSQQQLRQLGGTSEEELGQLERDLPGRARQIGGSNEVNRRYDDFLTRLNTASQRLQTLLIDKLVALSEPLSNVVDAFTNLVAAGLNTPGFRTGIESFAKWVNSFAVSLGSEETRERLRGAVTTIGDVLGGLGRMAAWLASWFPGMIPRPGEEGSPMYGPVAPGVWDRNMGNRAGDVEPGGAGATRASLSGGPGALGGRTLSAAELRDRFARDLGLTREQAAGLVSGLQSESSLNTGITRPGGQDFGLAQWVGPRRRALELAAAQRGVSRSDPELQIGFIREELMGQYAGVLRRLRASGTAREAGEVAHDYFASGGGAPNPAMENLRPWHARFSEDISRMPSPEASVQPGRSATVGYPMAWGGMNITIRNATGGNVVNSAAGLAAAGTTQ